MPATKAKKPNTSVPFVGCHNEAPDCAPAWVGATADCGAAIPGANAGDGIVGGTP